MNCKSIRFCVTAVNIAETLPPWRVMVCPRAYSVTYGLQRKSLLPLTHVVPPLNVAWAVSSTPFWLQWSTWRGAGHLLRCSRVLLYRFDTLLSKQCCVIMQLTLETPVSKQVKATATQRNFQGKLSEERKSPALLDLNSTKLLNANKAFTTF